jgi:hypothetical protein
MYASRPLGTTPIVAALIFPPRARVLSESKRRMSDEPLKRSTTVDFSGHLPAHSPVLLRPVRAATEANVLPRLVRGSYKECFRFWRPRSCS